MSIGRHATYPNHEYSPPVLADRPNVARWHAGGPSVPQQARPAVAAALREHASFTRLELYCKIGQGGSMRDTSSSWRVCWLLALLSVGCGSDVTERAELKASDLKADLATLAEARVFFGHQSVGNNILDGVTALANDSQVVLRVVEAPEGLHDDLPGIVHEKVGENRVPNTKCDAFGRFLTGRPEIRWDAVMLKFCYADLGDGGEHNPARMLDAYRQTVAAVRKARPELLVVHATSPLLSDGLGKRDRIRKLLGFGTSNDASNRLRNDFNRLLRLEYPSDPVFDIAQAESTRVDGTRVGFREGGRFYASMVPQYTYDEGHLTPEGRQWVAREFVRSLAGALREHAQTVMKSNPTSS